MASSFRRSAFVAPASILILRRELSVVLSPLMGRLALQVFQATCHRVSRRLEIGRCRVSPDCSAFLRRLIDVTGRFARGRAVYGVLQRLFYVRFRVRFCRFPLHINWCQRRYVSTSVDSNGRIFRTGRRPSISIRRSRSTVLQVVGRVDVFYRVGVSCWEIKLQSVHRVSISKAMPSSCGRGAPTAELCLSSCKYGNAIVFLCLPDACCMHMLMLSFDGKIVSSEGFVIFFYSVPLLWTTLETLKMVFRESRGAFRVSLVPDIVSV